MPNYFMPIKAIKKLMQKELDEFQNELRKAVLPGIHGVQREILDIGHRHLTDMLLSCNTYEDIEKYLSESGYGMSLEEWINSL